jgi:hypothetical protein
MLLRGQDGTSTPHKRYSPSPLNLPATHKRWPKDPASAEACDELADEFAALGEPARARQPGLAL